VNKFFRPLLLCLLIGNAPAFTHADPTPLAPTERVASLLLSQDFVNEQLQAHQKGEMLQAMSVELDADHDQIILRGVLHVPLEELRAINIDPRLGVFKFQLAIKLSTTKKGHLILEFPLNETYFYPADSKNPKQDRVIIPVQMLSLALASARGYLAAISGDFAGFDRRTDKLESLMKSLNHSIAAEKNADARDELKNQRESLRLQLEAVPVERKQLKNMSKEVSSILGFTGEKELNLNEELVARKNALVLKIKLSQLVPYLKGIELGGIRIVHDKKDGSGQNYLAIDINAELADSQTKLPTSPVSGNRPGMKTAPAIIVRLNQSLLESEEVISQEKAAVGANLRGFSIQLKEDGLHASGRWKSFLFFSIPFDTVVDFKTTGTDVFEVRVRKMDVAGLNVEFLSKYVLDSIHQRLDQSLKGICTFKDLGKSADDSRALQVTVDTKALVPAFPDLHLIDVDIRNQEFLLKMGHP
jgi:hypothetical protein